MKFSLWNFKEWYERRKLDLSYMISDNTASISLLATSQAAAKGRLGCALVLPAEELTDCTGFHTVLQFGSDRILFPVASPAEVLNEGAAMMESYTCWENALLDRIPANGAVPDFIQLSREVLPFPLALLSANGAVLFQSADWPLALGPQQIQSLFRKNPQRQPAQPYFRALPHIQPSTILAEVLNEQEIPVLLAACEDRKRFQPGDVHIFHTFAEILQAALAFRENALPALHPLSAWLSRQLPEQRELPPHQPAGTNWMVRGRPVLDRRHPASRRRARTSQDAVRPDLCRPLLCDGRGSALSAHPLANAGARRNRAPSGIRPAGAL